MKNRTGDTLEKSCNKNKNTVPQYLTTETQYSRVNVKPSCYTESVQQQKEFRYISYQICTCKCTLFDRFIA